MPQAHAGPDRPGGSAYPAMTKISTIKAGPKFSFGTAGLRASLTPRDRGLAAQDPTSSVGSQGSPRGQIPIRGLVTPGPGTYEVKPMEKHISQASWPFGCSTQLGRLETPREVTPGPGEYEAKPGAMRARLRGHAAGRPQSGHGEAAGFGSSTARKIASSPRSLSPNASVQSTKPQPNWNGGTPGEVGPGTYNTDKLSLARAAGARFGASHRFSPPDRASSPGPGAYETSVRSLTKGHQFQRAAVTTSRPSIPDSSSKSGPVATPGPAAYDTVAATRSTKKRMPGYSMRGRAQETRETSPGTADYGGHYTLFS